MRVLTVRPEEWRPVLGYEGYYEVSSSGRVRSLPRTAPRRVKGAVPVRGRVLTAYPDSHGYPSVKLSRDGAQRRRPVHVLVCEAWHGPRPDGMEARHLDDDKTNTAPENLRWGTRSENVRDRRRNGIDPNASKTECRNGHGYTPENTHVSPDGRRYCRVCMRASNRRSRDRARAAINDQLAEVA